MKQIIILLMVAFASSAFAADTTQLTIQIGGMPKFSQVKIKDQLTGSYVPATISNVSVQNNDPLLATVIVDPTNPIFIKATAIATGIGTAIVSCQATYTDPGDGLQKTETKSIVIKYTVIGAPHGVKLALTFN